MSSTPTPPPVPDLQETPPPRRRVYWKWSLGLTAVLLVFVAWQCVSGFSHGRSLSARAVEHFHGQLNGGRYTEIWEQADEAFRSTGSEQEFVRFLEAVHRKLGNAQLASLNTITVQTMTNGSSLVAVYRTQFDRDMANETFTWTQRADVLT